MSVNILNKQTRELEPIAGVPIGKLNLLETEKAEKTDLTNISITGEINTTGSTITQGTFFYLDNELVRALFDIPNGEGISITENIEYVTVGGLNKLNDEVSTLKDALSEATNDSGWQFLFSESSGFCKYRKIGKLVEIKIAYNDSFASKNFGALPQDFRPTNERVVASVNGGGAGNQLAYVEIRTDGYVIMAASSSITGAIANAMYFVG